jgi:streptogramin lyase
VNAHRIAILSRRILASSLFIAGALATGCSSSSSGSTTPAAPPPPTLAASFTTGITPLASLYQAVKGPDGRTWMSEFEGDAVAAATTSGVVTEYATGVNSQPNGIVVGPDGNIWAAGYGPGIYKITPAGVVTTYPLAGAHIGQLTVGADSNLWFDDYGNNTVGKITTAGAITSYPLPAGTISCGIASGTDGNLWLTDCGNGTIDKISTAGTILNSYSTGLSTKNPSFIIAAPDGNLYFTEPAFSGTLSDHIGKITTAGAITELAPLAPSTYPNVLTVGKDGNLYFTEYSKANVGRVTLSNGIITEFPLTLSGGDTGTDGIVNGADNRLWIGGHSTIYALTY